MAEMVKVRISLIWVFVGLVTLCPMTSQAGFLTGAVIGYAMAPKSGGGESPPPQGQLLASDKNDVITCREALPGQCEEYAVPIRGADKNGMGGTFDNPGRCAYRTQWAISIQEAHLSCTPSQYIVNAGYKTLHRVATVLDGGRSILVLEVSR